MSLIYKQDSEDWVEENHPENGLFRVYWKDVKGNYRGGATLDPEEGEGLRYEWYYKDGKMADGVSRGWFPNGNLKSEWTWKDGKANGVYTQWHMNGQKKLEGTFKNGVFHGKWTEWYENGQKRNEVTYND